MTDDPRPLLPLGVPAVGRIPTQRPRAIPRPQVPPARQAERLGPRFSALGEAIDARRITTGTTPTEADPELVVVLDLAGTVADFQRAVRDRPGLEFLVEIADEDLDPDDDFHVVDSRTGNRSKSKNRHTLYTMMTSAQAAQQLISLFERWSRREPGFTMPSGTAPLRYAFEQLVDVRPWGPADRVRETGLLERWHETVEVKGRSGSERVEIELWFRRTPRRRESAQAVVERLVRDAGGGVVTTSVIEDIGYHAVLADVPTDQVEIVLANGPEAIALLRTDAVMLVSPAEPMALDRVEPSDVPPPTPPGPPTEHRPRVALLDGLPMANHRMLADRLVVDDPDDLAADYPVSARQHGTAMASLICHGDLSDPGPPLAARLYVRPVMRPVEHWGTEQIDRDELLVDLLHRAFRRMFVGDGSGSPAAPSVRIVNLSLGDPARAFVRRMGPLARMIDWLTLTYNVVVIVSAGNHPDPPAVDAETVCNPTDGPAVMLDAVQSDAINRRLLAPAESINALTVGAAHLDGAEVATSDTVLDLTETGTPATFSPSGFGHGRSVKPELLASGGRQLFLRPHPRASGLVVLDRARQAAHGPGLLTAAPGPGGGRTAYGCGTSHATALATRACDRVLSVLTDLGSSMDGRDFPDAQYHPVLAKALLVHAADWSEMAGLLRTVLEGPTRYTLTRALGYGRLVDDRLAAATRTRACLLGGGSIRGGDRHTYSLPLPGALRTTKDWRRMTVTLAWHSPVNPRSREYRMAKLSVVPPMDRFGVDRAQADNKAVRNGTVWHEVFEGTKALGFQLGDRAAVEVDCRFAAGWEGPPVRYGLAVSIEMGTAVQADVHAEIREGLRARDRARAAIQPRG